MVLVELFQCFRWRLVLPQKPPHPLGLFKCFQLALRSEGTKK